MKERFLRAEGKGEYDYDFIHDIIFFKIRNREYVKSIELDNIVIDIDEEEFIVGIQIFEASEFLGLDKKLLLNIKNWKFEASVNEKRIIIKLAFQSVIRNKIIHTKPIIVERTEESLPNSEMICMPAMTK